MEKGFYKASTEFKIKKYPLSDGGDGSFEVISFYKHAKVHNILCYDPLFRKINAPVGIAKGVAIIEMAKATGLDLLKNSEKNALIADSYGTGQLIKSAIDLGVKEIILCLGGTASMDAGHGILRALGFRFLDAKGTELEPGCESLLKLSRIIVPENLDELNKTTFRIFSDVNTPLLGERGAARIFAPQKGATPAQVNLISDALTLFAGKIFEMTQKDIGYFQGGGAAGGVAAGLYSFFNINIQNGAEEIIELSGLMDDIVDTDLIVTGEGKLDIQTFNGKLPFAMAKLARKSGKKIIFIGGQIPGENMEDSQNLFDGIFSISPGPSSLSDSILNSASWLERTSFHIGKLLT